MDLELSKENGKTVVQIKGDIDIPGSGVLKKTLNTALENGSREIVLDFNSVTFIGTSGINTLLSFYIDFSGKGGKMSIINLDKNIGSVFEAIHLDKYFSL